jgi:hypothetical protein
MENLPEPSPATARDYYDKQAKARQKEGAAKGGGFKVQENLPEPKQEQARDAAGKAFGVSGRSATYL